MKLDTLEIGKDAVVASVTSDDQALRQHILDMGLTPGTEVTMMKYAPMGDPLEIRLRGYELTLRKDDAARIELVGVHDTDTGPRANAAIGTTEHPALGEGTYSPRAAKTAVPEGAPLHFALAGNQNCGKTTLFNQLTGSNQHVGNFPGVTVDRKDGTIRNHPEASVTDLPGIYSLSPYTGEEIVSRQFILDEHPDAIIDIIDATNIERNLYLTLQLMELDRPMVIALNMMDEVTANGGAVDVNLLESLLGVPVVPISAASPSFPSRRPRTRASASWWSTLCTWRGSASVPAAWTFARPTVRTVARCIAASTASPTLSRTMPRRRISRCVLQRPSWLRATSW